MSDDFFLVFVSNTMGTASGARTDKDSGAPELTAGC